MTYMSVGYITPKFNPLSRLWLLISSSSNYNLTIMSDQTSQKSRSQSRGRSVAANEFRNILPPLNASWDSGVATVREPKEHSVPRGRETVRNVPVEGDSSEGLHDGLHSTGRGGLANITAMHSPAVESHHLPEGPDEEPMSTGRGGAGNIRSRSRSQARGVEAPPPHSNHIVTSTGRGGVGNIRDRSKSQARADPPAREIDHAVVDDKKHGIDGIGMHRIIHHD